MKTTFIISALACTVAAPAFAGKPEVVANYITIAHTTYEDSLIRARELLTAVDVLLAEPSEENLTAAREAWVASRVPYMQTEAFRFGNAIVDDWEGKVNAWPLDEGLIDYVDASYGGATDENEYAALNVIASPSFTLSGEEIDATEITPELLSGKLQEADGVEANVATGYHAIEFLLWGQDLNGTEPGAGDRPWTDYASGEDCTGGNCDRRGAYLKAATELLVSDLEWMTEQWAEGGEAATSLTADPNAAISAMLTGMGSLSYGELAGERMKLGLMLNDPEEEHDCFSDNTHESHYYDGVSIQNVWLGKYERSDGSEITGESLSDLVAEADAGVAEAVTADIAASVEKLDAIRKKVADGMAYDQMLARGNDVGESLIMAAVDSLVAQTQEIERAVNVLGLQEIGFEGSDSLDNPDAVFQ